MDTDDNNIFFVICGIVIIIVLGIMAYTLWLGILNEQDKKICVEAHGVEYDLWGETKYEPITYNIEKGYLKCCRTITKTINHEYKEEEECDIIERSR